MVAMICGCSPLMRSAAVAASIHFRLSMPAVSEPLIMRDSSWLARSSPSALVSISRSWSSSDWIIVPLPKCSLTSISTGSTVSRDCGVIEAIFMVSFCTSRGPSWRSTPAAASGPSVISSSAAFSRPSSGVVTCAPPRSSPSSP